MNTQQDPAGSRLAPTTGSAVFAEIAAEVERATALSTLSRYYRGVTDLQPK